MDFIEKTSKVGGQVVEFVKSMGASRAVTHEYTHPDTKPTAKRRDIDATLRVANSLAEGLQIDPALDPGDLVSLSTGPATRSGQCNPETAKEF